MSHISQVVKFDSGGDPPVSADAVENRLVGSTGDGTGDGDREGTCMTVTASYMGTRIENSMNEMEFKQALIARAYEPTCVRLLGGGRITHCALR